MRWVVSINSSLVVYGSAAALIKDAQLLRYKSGDKYKYYQHWIWQLDLVSKNTSSCAIYTACKSCKEKFNWHLEPLIFRAAVIYTAILGIIIYVTGIQIDHFWKPTTQATLFCSMAMCMFFLLSCSASPLPIQRLRNCPCISCVYKSTTIGIHVFFYHQTRNWCCPNGWT